MNKSPLHIGWRTAKTGIAVFICVFLFKIFHRGSPLYAALSAVFSMRNDHKTSLNFGLSRFFGNLSGGLLAILAVAIRNQLPSSLVNWSDIILAPLCIILIILFCNQFNPKAVINSSATFLVILFTISPTQGVPYAIQRVLDTFIGVIIAILVNVIFPNQHLEQE